VEDLGTKVTHLQIYYTKQESPLFGFHARLCLHDDNFGKGAADLLVTNKCYTLLYWQLDGKRSTHTCSAPVYGVNHRRLEKEQLLGGRREHVLMSD
jgi:hypothetical protein